MTTSYKLLETLCSVGKKRESEVAIRGEHWSETICDLIVRSKSGRLQLKMFGSYDTVLWDRLWWCKVWKKKSLALKTSKIGCMELICIRRSFSITLQMIAAGEWKWKWSNSVLKSEMGIFWCISITNNVKSYKKFDGKAQTAKFTVFAREISSTALKTWKTRKTKTWIAQNFQILYHIQGGTMGKSTSSAFRTCGTFWMKRFLKGSNC